MPSSVRSTIVAVGFVLAALIALTAQERPAPQTFATGTELVLVDFVVTDKADHPVKGLTAKDFVVKEDGKERPIASFDAFGGDAPAAAARGQSPESSAPAPPVPRASTVILVDDNQLSQQQAARLRPAFKGLIAKTAEPSGALMLVAPGSRISLLGQIPANTAALAAAADGIAGFHRDEQSNFPIADAEALEIARGELTTLARVAARFVTLNPEMTADQATVFARELANKAAHDARARRNAMYDAVLACLDWLGGRPGRHSLIVVSAGFSQDPDDSKYYDVLTRSLRANAPIHFLDARGLQGISGYSNPETSTLLRRNADEGPFGFWQAASGSMALADETGGLSISNSNDMEKGLGHLLDTMTTYYVLAYQPPAHDKPGYRKIKVEVKVKGLQVRARHGYFSGAPAPR